MKNGYEDRQHTGVVDKKNEKGPARTIKGPSPRPTRGPSKPKRGIREK